MVELRPIALTSIDASERIIDIAKEQDGKITPSQVGQVMQLEIADLDIALTLELQNSKPNYYAILYRRLQYLKTFVDQTDQVSIYITGIKASLDQHARNMDSMLLDSSLLKARLRYLEQLKLTESLE